MAADTRTLTVSLVAEVASLKKGMNEAKGQLGGLQKSAASTANAIKTAFGAMAGVFAAQQIAQGVRSMVDSFQETAGMIEDTKHLAEALGSTTEEMQILQRSAAFAEVDVDMLNRNLKIMTKNLGNASIGTGPAVKALEDLGLSAQNLIRMPITHQVQAIAEGMNRLTSQSQKAAMAAALFGRAGIEMLPFLSDGALDLQTLGDEMMRTGELFSLAEAGAVDEMGDAMVALGAQVQALENQLVIALAPAITKIVAKIKEFVDSAGGARTIVANAMNTIIQSVGGVMQRANQLKAVWLEVKAVILLLAAVWVNEWRLLFKTLNVLITGLVRGFWNMVDQIASAIDFIVQKASAVGDALGLSIAKDFSVRDNIQGQLQAAVKASQEANAEWTSHVKTLGGSDPWVTSLIGDARTALTEAGKIRKEAGGTDWSALLADLFTAPEGSNAVMAQADAIDNIITPAIKEQKDLQKSITDEIKEQVKLTKDAGQGMAVREGEFSLFRGRVSGGSGGGGMNAALAPSMAATGAVGGASRMAAIDAMAKRDAKAMFLAQNPNLSPFVREKMGLDGSPNASMAVRNASSASGKGGDQAIPLLSGILDAVRRTAENTSRAQVAVAG